jgi:hypothetical protein
MRQGMYQAVFTGGRPCGSKLLAGLVVFFLALMVAGPAPLQAASQIASIMLANQADANGVVAKHQDRFALTAGDIHGTALIAGAVKGKQVTTELFYVTQNLRVLSFTEDLTAAGEATMNFTIPKPDNGWRAGRYKLVIRTSDGATKEATFQVK